MSLRFAADDKLTDRRAHLGAWRSRRRRCRSCRSARRTHRSVAPAAEPLRRLRSRRSGQDRAQSIELMAPRKAAVAELLVGEHRLHEVLAVVERARRPRRRGRWLSTVVICRRCTSGTRPPDGARRCRCSPAATRRDGSRARVAGGRPDDRCSFVSPVELVRRSAGRRSWSAMSLNASVGPWKNSCT